MPRPTPNAPRVLTVAGHSIVLQGARGGHSYALTGWQFEAVDRDGS